MRAVIFICVSAWVMVVGQDISTMMNLPKYDSRYDYLDIDAILDSKRLVKNYVECLISSQRCPPEGKALKKILPEALRTKCVRCTDKQKQTAVKVIKRIKYGYPAEWAKLQSRWDPTGDFTRYFEEYLAKEKFNTIPDSGTNDIPSSPIPASPETFRPPTPYLPPPTPVVLTVPQTTAPAVDITTPRPGPMIVNRFGEEGEVMVGSPSSAAASPRPMTMRPTIMLATMPTTMQTRPTQMMWFGSASDAMPTRYPARPSELPIYTTAVTLIDQISYKIIRTTELVSDILKNTVRAVVGR